MGRQFEGAGHGHLGQMAEHAPSDIADVLLSLAKIAAERFREAITNLADFAIKSLLGIDQLQRDSAVDAVDKRPIVEQRQMGFKNRRMGFAQLVHDAMANLLKFKARLLARVLETCLFRRHVVG